MAAAAESAAPTVAPEDLSPGRQEPIFLADDTKIGLDQLRVSANYKQYLSHVMIPQGYINDRIAGLADQIAAEHLDTCPHLLCVLNGASVFMMKLVEELHKAYSARACCVGKAPFTIGFCRVKSYAGTASTGEVLITGLIGDELKGRTVIVVEDIVDTGLSMTRLLPKLREELEVEKAVVCSLIEKRTEKSCGLKARYVGFSVPDHFVVGCGLDFNEAFRELNHICVINKAGIEKFKDFLLAKPSA
ncbi:hypothetical protein FNF27_01172 [Cafeteria roenbergensis]|uniref:Phosphoribosyltransferase domain-containing protein n=2 Tax=Cafeteria roenbergensis TaxID=33653 RepID=A0A5A8D126_CAFRO|nr:hypothetical protein FNF29_00798 [Cafeteria roenbergensis]KAA0158925.1 hypothetical protein FNF31_05095 [Cafeteria roenbergensis]KAA0165183.1 hypothetical protein FNF28_03582 [Cafeteria roenbergensis]KAA0177394.1 hypothetical protein FNF27_01172 [Cafeteria roenbergensis]|eukprot:KAA0156687.1 hypothetical protein FNF29_00798 [Cafeteria roenbergensis]